MHERPRPARHGLVTVPALAAAALALVAAVAGGLLRACPATPPPGLPAWLVAGAAWHAALMTGGFLGTVVALERAVAARRRAAWLAPIASAVAAALLAGGRQPAGALMLVVAAVCALGTNLLIARRQPAAHTALLVLAAAAWLAGNALFLAGAGAAIPSWFAFLVLTIAAERLEMTRLTRRGRTTQAELLAIVALMLAGTGLASSGGAGATAGLACFGASLALLSCWLFARDIATRTLRGHGLARYMAICLLLGYGWLAAAGIGWVGLAFGRAWRDLALHALGLGFVASMMMAHAPVILPALTGLRVRFGAAFYVPVALLQASLYVRLGPGLDDLLWRGIGAFLNAAALLAFAATLAIGAARSRVRRPATPLMETP
ncbi:MAG: hypothetical protein ACTHL8_26425 [Burkholderiaceae bacterium]